MPQIKSKISQEIIAAILTCRFYKKVNSLELMIPFELFNQLKFIVPNDKQLELARIIADTFDVDWHNYVIAASTTNKKCNELLTAGAHIDKMLWKCYTDIPISYTELCEVWMPRVIHNDAELSYVVEKIGDSMAGFEDNFNQDQNDYFAIICQCIETYENKF